VSTPTKSVDRGALLSSVSAAETRNGDTEESRRDQASGERDARAPHSVACFRGAACKCRDCNMCQVCVISFAS